MDNEISGFLGILAALEVFGGFKGNRRGKRKTKKTITKNQGKQKGCGVFLL